ncbi:hypothetical protein PM082_010047 [Marasmius tenuissimus]|nr:hypothetical protein PM082_010047 [Marasmius tenuissimus]
MLQRLLVIHTLAHVTAIQLHYIFAAQGANSHAIVVSNAETTFDQVLICDPSAEYYSYMSFKEFFN